MEYFKIKRRMIELDAMLKAKMELIPFLESEDEDQRRRDKRVGDRGEENREEREKRGREKRERERDENGAPEIFRQHIREREYHRNEEGEQVALETFRRHGVVESFESRRDEAVN